MEDASIVAVGPAADFQPEMVGQVVEQFPTSTLLPGLIEADAHLTLFANREPYERMFEEPDE
jgi:imidazolonepropionase-like amidohydrolase